MSDIQFEQFFEYEPYTKPAFNSSQKPIFNSAQKPIFNSAQKPFRSYILSTRSNTPDGTSPSKLSDSSDQDFSTEVSTPTSSPLSGSNNLAYPEFFDGSNFEIDVRPKRRKFNTIQDRIQFVEEYKRKFKTEMCKNWELRGTCKFGDKCCFAHGRHELKAKALTHIKYKTKPCKQYHQTGFCPYGQRCQYLHKEALTPNIFFRPLEDKQKQGFYTYDMLNNINVLCATDDTDVYAILDCLPQRPRLSIFKTSAVSIA